MSWYLYNSVAYTVILLSFQLSNHLATPQITWMWDGTAPNKNLPASGILNPLFNFFIINFTIITDKKLIHVIWKLAKHVDNRIASSVVLYMKSVYIYIGGGGQSFAL